VSAHLLQTFAHALSTSAPLTEFLLFKSALVSQSFAQSLTVLTRAASACLPPVFCKYSAVFVHVSEQDLQISAHPPDAAKAAVAPIVTPKIKTNDATIKAMNFALMIYLLIV
jgi:hypothetical protein